MDHKKKDAPVSQALLVISRTWLYMAIGALALYFIVAAIERNHVTLRVTATRSYRVPVEYEEDKEAE